MANTKTKAAIAVELALPPNGGNLSLLSTLEEDAHYLRVTLDKAENFRVAVGVRLLDLLKNKFANNRNALRDWYEERVVQGKAHRAWSGVEPFLRTVNKHGPEAAAEILDRREEARRDWQHQYDVSRGRVKWKGPSPVEKDNEINEATPQQRPVKSEYELRKEWLSDMNVLWFKGEREWQDRWLQDRRLSRHPGSG